MTSHGDKVIVAGGEGFLGKRLVSALARMGYAPVIIDKAATDLGDQAFAVDILNFDAVRHVLDVVRPIALVNLTGAPAGKEACDSVNFEAAKNLLDAGHRAACRRMIFLGTADEYGHSPIPQSETLPTNAASDYAISKANMTAYALKAFKKYSAPVTVLRPFTAYGAGQPRGMFLSQAISAALSGSTFEMTMGEQRRDYVFADDLIEAILATLTGTDIDGEVINIGTGASHQLRDIAMKVWQITGADPRLLRIGARPSTAAELHDTCAETSKAERLLRWRAKVSLDDGLKRTIAAYRGDEHAKGPYVEKV